MTDSLETRMVIDNCFPATRVETVVLRGLWQKKPHRFFGECMVNFWTKENSTTATAQGWDVFEIWDGRLEYEIQRVDVPKIFASDELARRHVLVSSYAGDALATKARRIVFNSKVGTA